MISNSKISDNSQDGEQKGRIPFAVLGGGISGLSLAYELRAAGFDARVFEKRTVPGGVIGGVEKEGFLFERGPNTLLEKPFNLGNLLSTLEIEGETIRTPLASQDRYIWHGGALRKVPTSPLSVLTTPLLTLKGKLRALAEPFIPRVKIDESLQKMIERRLGPEIYERAFLPMVQGIWAGDPAQMSAAHSFPILKQFERGHGGLIKGLIASARAKKEYRRMTGISLAPPSMVSFNRGLERLPRALADSLGPACQLGCDIETVTPLDGGGYRIQSRTESKYETWDCDRLALCADSGTVGKWIEPFEPELAAKLKAVHYAPLIVVGLGVEASSLKIPPGFGFLAARNQGLRILGVIFNSNFLPDRAPEGCAALTIMLGGDLDPDAMSLTDDAILDVVKRDLKTALGWNGEAKAFHIERWPRAVPRYGLDHAELIAAFEETETRRRDLWFCGNWRDGVSLGDRIALTHSLVWDEIGFRSDAKRQVE